MIDSELNLSTHGQIETGYVVASGASIAEYGGEYGPPINLGLGTPPIGIATELVEPLAERRSGNDLTHYSEDPLHTKTRELIVESLDLQGIGPESIVLNGNGSYGAGDEAVRFLSLEGYKTIYVPNYSFPNVAQWAVRHSVDYAPVNTEGLNPVNSLERILSFGKDQLSHAIVYIDYPNNPFGITYPDLMRNVVKYTAENGGVPIVDGAFGEVLGEEHTKAIQFTLDHGGIALGSITKTQGGAKLRTGWSIMANRFTQNGYSGDQRLVFGLNDEAEFVLKLLFSRDDTGKILAQHHAARVASYNEHTNTILYPELESLGLKVLPTDTRTAIQVVASDKLDFYQRLIQVGIETESLGGYNVTLDGAQGYGDSAVRMLTPKPGQLQEVVRRLGIAMNL